MNMTEMMENLGTAVVACDSNMIVTYANPKFKELMKSFFKMENFVGNHMADCHKPETMVKLNQLVQEYKAHKRKLHYYTVPAPEGKVTFVNVPVFDNDQFAGLFEFIFEGSLG